MKKNFSINANNYFTIKLFVRGSKLIRTFIHISFGIKKSTQTLSKKKLIIQKLKISL